MKSISRFGKTTNVFPLAIPIATGTDILTLPVIGEQVSIILKHTGMNAATKIQLYRSNDG